VRIDIRDMRRKGQGRQDGRVQTEQPWEKEKDNLNS
jgi:hypothetical protein